MRKKINKINKYQKIMLVGTIVLFIGVCFLYGYAPKYNEIDYKKICDEAKETNQYLIKSCNENGGVIEVEYYENSTMVKLMRCVR